MASVKKKRKRARPGVREIRRDVTQEFNDHLKKSKTVLDASGRIVFAEVFDLTVGLFAKKCARLKPSLRVWENKKFKSFILGQTKRIALEANRHAKNGVITGRAFNRASLVVMRKTQKFCRLAISSGRIQDIRPGHVVSGNANGEVCSTYLATQG